MRKTFIYSLIFAGIFAGSVLSVNADTSTSTAAVTSSGLFPAGAINCFDYYKFGSVQVELTTPTPSAQPGSTMTFTGNIVNNNAYPLVSGSVYVKIFRKDGDQKDAHQNGFYVVDQFFAKENVSLAANARSPISFTWKVPAGAVAGDYEIATYYQVEKEYDMLGLSFTNDIVGQTYNFKVAGKGTAQVYLAKSGVTVGGQPFLFAAFPTILDASSTVKVNATLVNTTNQSQTATVFWTTYKWAGLRSDYQIGKPESQTVTLKPGEKKQVTYSVSDAKYPVYYVTAEADYKDTKSILDIRFVRSGNSELNLLLPAVTSYPLKAGQETTLFSCLHNVSNQDAKGGTMDLTVVDSSGNKIASMEYSGAVTANMMAAKSAFTPQKDYTNFTIQARLYQNGQLQDSADLNYDCKQIDPSLCPVSTSIFTPTIIIGGIILIIIIIILIYLIIKKRKGLMVVAFGILLAGSIGVHTTHASTAVSWTNPPILNMAGNPNYDGGIHNDSHNLPTTDPDKAYMLTNGIAITGQYNILVQSLNAATYGQEISNGSSVNIGDKIRLVISGHQNTDVSWSGTGGYLASPYAYWVSAAANPGAACDPSDHIPTLDRTDFVGKNLIGVSAKGYVSFSVNPPVENIAVDSSILSCTALTGSNSAGWYRDCTVIKNGTIAPSFTFGSTYASFYFQSGIQGQASYSLAGIPYSDPNRFYCLDNGAFTAPEGGATAQFGVPALTGTITLTALQAPPIGSINTPGSCSSPTAITGYSCDPDKYENNLGINIGDGTTSIPGTANQLDAADYSSCLGFTTTSSNMSGYHGFAFPVPDAWKDGAVHRVYATAQDIDSYGNPGIYGAKNLNNSGTYTIQCAIPTITGLSATCSASGNGALTFTWTGLPSAYYYALRIQTTDAPNVSQNLFSNMTVCATNTLCPSPDKITGNSFTTTGVPGHTYGWFIQPRPYSNNAYGTTTNGTSVTCPLPAPQAPTASLTANPSTITNGPGTTLLTWNSTNSTSCAISSTNNGGSWSGLGVSGTKTTSVLAPGSPTATYIYTLTCTGAGGTATDSKTVTVTGVTVQPPTASLTLTPTWVNGGATVQMSWSSTNASSCSITSTNGDNWTGLAATGTKTSLALNGSTSVSSYPFTLTCTGTSGGTVTDVKNANVPLIPSGLVASCGTGNVLTFSWNSLQSPYYYSLRVFSNATIPGMTKCVTGTNGGPDTQCVDTQVSKTFTSTGVAGQTYVWWVHSRYPIGGTPASSDPFSTAAATDSYPAAVAVCPGPIPPTPTVIAQTRMCYVSPDYSKADLKWLTSPGATGYKVFRSPDNIPAHLVSIGTFTNSDLVIGQDDYVRFTDVTNPPLTDNTAYYYAVQAYNASGSSAMSTAVSSTSSGSCGLTASLTVIPGHQVAGSPVDPTYVDVSDTASLQWSSTNATTCSITSSPTVGLATPSQWTSLSTSGNKNVGYDIMRVSGNYFTYTLLCKDGSGRSATDVKSLQVVGGPTPPDLGAACSNNGSNVVLTATPHNDSYGWDSVNFWFGSPGQTPKDSTGNTCTLNQTTGVYNCPINSNPPVGFGSTNATLGITPGTSYIWAARSDYAAHQGIEGGWSISSPFSCSGNTGSTGAITCKATTSTANPATSANVGQLVTWSAFDNSGNPASVTWSSADIKNTPAPTGTKYLIRYNTIGQKSMTATSGGTSYQCTAGVNNTNLPIVNDPNFKDF